MLRLNISAYKGVNKIVFYRSFAGAVGINKKVVTLTAHLTVSVWSRHQTTKKALLYAQSIRVILKQTNIRVQDIPRHPMTEKFYRPFAGAVGINKKVVTLTAHLTVLGHNHQMR